MIIIGGFNGHVGKDMEGVAGNKDDRNSNGCLLRSFVAANNLP